MHTCGPSYNALHNFMEYQYSVKRVGRLFPMLLPTLHRLGAQPYDCRRRPCLLFHREDRNDEVWAPSLLRRSIHTVYLCFPAFILPAWQWGIGAPLSAETDPSICVLEHSPACLLRDLYPSISSSLPVSLITRPRFAHFCLYLSTLHVRSKHTD